jgi:hypothetical protein
MRAPGLKQRLATPECILEEAAAEAHIPITLGEFHCPGINEFSALLWL